MLLPSAEPSLWSHVSWWQSLSWRACFANSNEGLSYKPFTVRVWQMHKHVHALSHTGTYWRNANLNQLSRCFIPLPPKGLMELKCRPKRKIDGWGVEDSLWDEGMKEKQVWEKVAEELWWASLRSHQSVYIRSSDRRISQRKKKSQTTKKKI